MPYGDGSVFQRSYDQRWIGRLEAGRDLNGRRIRHQVSGKTREEVDEKLSKVRESLSKGGSVLPMNGESA